MGLPSFTTNNSNLSELNYSSGSGPSGNLSVYVTGLNITTGVIVTPPADFEICLTSGGTYQLAPLTIPGSANNIPFFVRLKAGLKPGIYNNETIVCTSNGATPVNITVSGTVYASNFYSQASGNWNSNTTWSNNYYGGPTAPLGAYPLEGDNVFIENDYIVTVNVNSACATLNGSLYKSGTLMFGGPYTLNVSGKVQLGGSGDINQKGSIKFANGSTLNADNLTFGGTAPGIINMTSGGILNISSLNVNTITGNNWTPGTGTVIMNATNTLPATLFTTFNNLTFNAGTTTATTALTILGNLNLNTGATFEGGAFTHNIAGNWTNNGGRFTPGTGTTNFTGSSSSINGSTNTQIFNNIIVAKNPGTSLSYAGNTNLTLNGDLTLSTGTFTLGATLIVSGNWLNNGGVFNPGTGIVTLNGSGKNIGGLNATTFNNLTIASPGNINVMKSVSISGLLTMASGLLSTSTTHLLSITNTSPTAISGGSVT